MIASRALWFTTIKAVCLVDGVGIYPSHATNRGAGAQSTLPKRCLHVLRTAKSLGVEACL